MPQANNACGWKGCTNEAEAEVHLDAGSTTCSECGQETTDRRTYKLCGEHNEQYSETMDVTTLLLNAKEA